MPVDNFFAWTPIYMGLRVLDPYIWGSTQSYPLIHSPYYYYYIHQYTDR